MSADMLRLPGQHRHSGDARLDRLGRIDAGGIDLASVEKPIQEGGLARRALEQRRHAASGLGGVARQGFGGGRGRQSPSNRASITWLGRTTFQPDAGRPSPATAPSA
jgi:hypothetical protein